MKYLSILLLIYTLIKSIYYAIYEFKEKKNKLAGCTVIFLAIIGFILPMSLILTIY